MLRRQQAEAIIDARQKIVHGAVSMVQIWAQQEFRSVNGQIEFLLRQAVSRRRGQRPPSPPEDEPPDDGPQQDH